DTSLGLKLLPFIIIVLPTPPNAGVIKSTLGWAIINDTKNNIEKNRFITLFIILMKRLTIT
ncbi:MAG: hypothetical protein ACKVLE_09935, partial [Fidelibacterota bacterium]